MQKLEAANLRALIQQEYAIAKSTIENGDEVIPHFVVQDGKGEIQAIMTPIFDKDCKAAIASFMKQYVAENDITRYVFVAEAWTIKRDKDDFKEDELPSECDDRIEIVALMGVSHQETVANMAEIERDGKNFIVGPMNDECGDVKGMFAELLPTLN